MSKTTNIDVKQIQRHTFLNIAKRARELAETIAESGTNALSPSDSALCGDALRAYAAQVEAGFALVAPPPRIGVSTHIE